LLVDCSTSSHLYFIDLLQVSPQSHNGDIIYENSDGIVIRYNKHHQQDLELPVQEKLRQLPMVIKYLIEPMHKGIR